MEEEEERWKERQRDGGRSREAWDAGREVGSNREGGRGEERKAVRDALEGMEEGGGWEGGQGLGTGHALIITLHSTHLLLVLPACLHVNQHLWGGRDQARQWWVWHVLQHHRADFGQSLRFLLFYIPLAVPANVQGV